MATVTIGFDSSGWERKLLAQEDIRPNAKTTKIHLNRVFAFSIKSLRKKIVN
jgi:hypothetical protein